MKKIALYSFIFFLLLSALIAIISVISGAFGQLEIKFLITTSVVALASVCALASSSAQHRQIGTIGIILAVLAATLLVAGVWLNVSNDFYWRASAIISVFSVALAHFLALSTVSLPDYGWLKASLGISIAGLAGMFAFLFITEFNYIPRRFMTVLAILVALQTVVIPILARINKTKSLEKLILLKQADGSYQSPDGRHFQVTEISKPYTKA